MKRYALFSCSNKTGLSNLARFFQNRKYDIISTGGTYHTLKKDKSVDSKRVWSVTHFTEFPEILDGRVKTLHPTIHAGILANRNDETHTDILERMDMVPIDIVVTNFYPFQDIVDKYSSLAYSSLAYVPPSTEKFKEIIEHIDIGGVTLARSAAKNFEHVTVITDPKQYSTVMKSFDTFTVQDRFKLATEAYRATQKYDKQVYDWMHRHSANPEKTKFVRKTHSYVQKRRIHTSSPSNYFGPSDLLIGLIPGWEIFGNNTATNTPNNNKKPRHARNEYLTRKYTPQFDLKYGSNPHQNLAGGSRVYSNNASASASGSFPFTVMNGTPSYINMLDAINSWQLVTDLRKRFGTIAAASYKHTSPAGAAILTHNELKNNPDVDHATMVYKKAREGDPMCSFGDFIAINGLVTSELARYIAPLVSDGIIASGFYSEAIDILRKKKKGTYVMIQANENTNIPDVEFREIYGIALSQPVNRATIEWDDLDVSNIVTEKCLLTEAEKQNLMLANLSLKYAQSNNVAIAYNGQLIGISSGQQSRIHSVRLATHKAKVWLLRNDPIIEKCFQHIEKQMSYQDAVNFRMRFIEHALGEKLTPNEINMYNKKYGASAQFIRELEQLINGDDGTQCTQRTQQYHGISLASDAFFPFRDNIDCASKIGVSAIVQPGGSVRDDIVIDACNEYKMKMVCHEKRMFTH